MNLVLDKGKWTAADVPDMTGKRVLITGANSGIGLEAAKVIAGKGGEVILACRSASKAHKGIQTISEKYPAAFLAYLELDLADLDSIARAANLVKEKYSRLDVLINNAGVMWLPQTRTVDGFEMQIGTNHFGHFALTGRLLPLLLNTPNSRIVTVSSLAHYAGRINFDDIHYENDYQKQKVYSQSKLANLLFAYELQRKLEQMRANCLSVAVHPGISSTNLAAPGFEMEGRKVWAKMSKFIMTLITQSAEKGCLPTLYAATSDNVRGGEYFGPGGYRQFFGNPKKVRSSKQSHDRDVATKLWKISEDLTQISYSVAKEEVVV